MDVRIAIGLATASFVHIVVATRVAKLPLAPLPQTGTWQGGLRAVGAGVIHLLRGERH
ncbi:MAG: hypothetical protein AB1830_03955 [Pseudomonadota bacterium]